MTRPIAVQAPGELLSFLFSVWPEVKRIKIRSWLKNGSILINEKPVTRALHILAPGDMVAIRPVRHSASGTALSSGMKVWFEDAHVIVIDKVPGLLSIASHAEREKTAYSALTEYLRKNQLRRRERAWIVHRLDQETSGLMIFAKNPEAKKFLQNHWNQVEKRYEAIVDGHMPAQEGVLTCDLDERHHFKVQITKASQYTRHAITHYKVLAENRQRSLIQLRLETGRRHQIRVQLAAAGCPIIGDKKYGAQSDPAGRLGLHATFLKFPHPVTKNEIEFSSPLSKALVTHAPTRKNMA